MSKVLAITFQYVLNTLQQVTGIDRTEMLKCAGSPPVDGDVDSGMLSAVFRCCMERTGNRDLALDIGRSIPYQSLGLLGYLLLNTRDLKQMIEKFNRYQKLVSRHLKFHFSDDGKYYRLAIYINENKNLPVPDYHAEVHLAAIVSILTQVLGRRVVPAVTMLSQKRAEGRERLREIFGDNIIFSSEENTVCFRKDALNMPVDNANQAMLAFFEGEAEKILHGMEDDSWLSRVEREILKNIGDAQVTVGFVAARLNVSSRTLQNRLRDEKTTFAEALCTVRRRLADYYLRDTKMSDENISSLLGYSEASAFYRAYRKWNGTTPSYARKNGRNG